MYTKKVTTSSLVVTLAPISKVVVIIQVSTARYFNCVTIAWLPALALATVPWQRQCYKWAWAHCMDINRCPGTCSIKAWVHMLGNISWSSEFICYLVSNLYTDYIHYDIVFPGEWIAADSGQALEAHFAKDEIQCHLKKVTIVSSNWKKSSDTTLNSLSVHLACTLYLGWQVQTSPVNALFMLWPSNTQ